jgi:hypothetical protein
MTKRLARVLLLGLMTIAIPTMLWAQNDRKANAASSLYLISAKAGAVNYVAGDVSLVGTDAKKGSLKTGDEIQVGERVVTAFDGKAEVLLNPGSYVRLGSNSEFEFVTTSLDDLELKVNKGSAIFEVIADKEFKVTIKTPDAKFYLISSGVYRVDVTEIGTGTISVWKGKAQLGDTKATVIKGGKSATVANDQAVIAKFDRDNKTEFDNWSKDRAKAIAKNNAKLMQREMRRSLFNTFNTGWSGSNGYGLWVQDPFSRSFCFLPFGWGWRSPYGFGYDQSIWNYNPPPQVVQTMTQNTVINNPNNSQTVMNPPPVMMPGNTGGNGNGGGMSGSAPISSPLPTRETDRPMMERPASGEKPGRARPIDN